MTSKVLVYRPLPEQELARLNALYHVVEMTDVASPDEPRFIAELADADAIIGVGLTLGAIQLDGASQLKVVSTISVGTDAFDLAYLGKRGIPVMHTPTVLTETTADTIFSLILCTARRVIELDKFVRSGDWQKSIGPEWFGANVHGKTLGIVGMGRIGSAIARRAHHGFGMNILYFNRSTKPIVEAEYDAEKVSFDTLLARSDFVCSVLPYSAETDKIFNQTSFAKMNNEAFFINGGRGKTVDESALITALQSGQIKGAGLDVYEQEPLPADSPLMTMNNVVLLPHIGSATLETRNAMAHCAVDNVIAALDGNVSANCANASLLMTPALNR